MNDNLKLVLRAWLSPAAAMSETLDGGSLLFSLASVLVVTFILQTPAARAGISFGFFMPLLVLAAVYVPGVLLLSRIFGSATDFRRDYAPLLTCSAIAWTAAYLPLAILSRVFIPQLFGILALAAIAYFLVLMFFAVRTVFGAGSGVAAGVVALSWLPLLAAAFLWGPLQFLLGWLASPFVLLYAWYFFRNEAGDLGAGLRNRQNFRRMLDAAAVNPHDAEAQYQLGLIYQQRRQLTEAIRRFEAAVAIDPKEVDAQFQLGRIALEQGRLKDALARFQIVLDLDEKHHQSEILRELGALYIAAGQFSDAHNELATYIERRPYDPEGLYYFGRSLEGLNRTPEARDAFTRSVEAARVSPPYLRRSAAKWSRLSQKQLRKVAHA